jgi:hypothetical protein
MLIHGDVMARVFDQMTLDQEKKYEKLKDVFKGMFKELSGFMHVVDVEFPSVQKNAKEAVKDAKYSRYRFYSVVFNQRRLKKLRTYYDSLKLAWSLKRKEKQRLLNLQKCLAKYHRYREFNKLRNICYLMKETNRTDSTPGSFRMIKELKERMRHHEKEVKQVLDLKANQQDLETLSEQTKSKRALHLFSDLKQLFDSNVKKHWDFLQEREKEQRKKHNEALSTLTKFQVEMGSFRDSNVQQLSKLEEVQARVEQLTFEHGRFSSQLGEQAYTQTFLERPDSFTLDKIELVNRKLMNSL